MTIYTSSIYPPQVGFVVLADTNEEEEEAEAEEGFEESLTAGVANELSRLGVPAAKKDSNFPRFTTKFDDGLFFLGVLRLSNAVSLPFPELPFDTLRSEIIINLEKNTLNCTLAST